MRAETGRLGRISILYPYRDMKLDIVSQMLDIGIS